MGILIDRKMIKKVEYTNWAYLIKTLLEYRNNMSTNKVDLPYYLSINLIGFIDIPEVKDIDYNKYILDLYSELSDILNMYLPESNIKLVKSKAVSSNVVLLYV